MRRFTVSDAFAAVLVAAVVVPFVGYSVRGSMPFVEDPRGMAGIGLVGGLLAFAALGRNAFGKGAVGWAMTTLAVATLGVAIAAVIVETSWALLVPMVTGIALVATLAMLRRAALARSTEA
jgi:hypothetical protein